MRHVRPVMEGEARPAVQLVILVCAPARGVEKGVETVVVPPGAVEDAQRGGGVVEAVGVDVVCVGQREWRVVWEQGEGKGERGG